MQSFTTLDSNTNTTNEQKMADSQLPGSTTTSMSTTGTGTAAIMMNLGTSTKALNIIGSLLSNPSREVTDNTFDPYLHIPRPETPPSSGYSRICFPINQLHQLGRVKAKFLYGLHVQLVPRPDHALTPTEQAKRSQQLQDTFPAENKVILLELRTTHQHMVANPVAHLKYSGITTPSSLTSEIFLEEQVPEGKAHMMKHETSFGLTAKKSLKIKHTTLVSKGNYYLVYPENYDVAYQLFEMNSPEPGQARTSINQTKLIYEKDSATPAEPLEQPEVCKLLKVLYDAALVYQSNLLQIRQPEFLKLLKEVQQQQDIDAKIQLQQLLESMDKTIQPLVADICSLKKEELDNLLELLGQSGTPKLLEQLEPLAIEKPVTSVSVPIPIDSAILEGLLKQPETRVLPQLLTKAKLQTDDLLILLKPPKLILQVFKVAQQIEAFQQIDTKTQLLQLMQQAYQVAPCDMSTRSQSQFPITTSIGIQSLLQNIKTNMWRLKPLITKICNLDNKELNQLIEQLGRSKTADELLSKLVLESPVAQTSTTTPTSSTSAFQEEQKLETSPKKPTM